MWIFRYSPYFATVLATLWACFVWGFLVKYENGMLLLALAVGTFTIATWLTDPFGLIEALNRTPPISLMPWAIVVMVITGSIAGDDSGLTPAMFASGVLAGFASVLSVYPYRKLEMLPEWMTLVGAACGLATFAIYGNIWLALIIAIAARALFYSWRFYYVERLARASCPIPHKRFI